jgi:hypothetical protein
MVQYQYDVDWAKAARFVGRTLALVSGETFGNPITAMLANFTQCGAFKAAASAGRLAWRCTWRCWKMLRCV